MVISITFRDETLTNSANTCKKYSSFSGLVLAAYSRIFPNSSIKMNKNLFCSFNSFKRFDSELNIFLLSSEGAIDSSLDNNIEREEYSPTIFINSKPLASAKTLFSETKLDLLLSKSLSKAIRKLDFPVPYVPIIVNE